MLCICKQIFSVRLRMHYRHNAAQWAETGMTIHPYGGQSEHKITNRLLPDQENPQLHRRQCGCRQTGTATTLRPDFWPRSMPE